MSVLFYFFLEKGLLARLIIAYYPSVSSITTLVIDLPFRLVDLRTPAWKEELIDIAQNQSTQLLQKEIHPRQRQRGQIPPIFRSLQRCNESGSKVLLLSPFTRNAT